MSDAVVAAIRVNPVQFHRIAMPNRGSTSRDFVVFWAKGEDYCRAHRPDEDCELDVGLTWAMIEVLGAAVIEYEDPTELRVEGYRFAKGASTVPISHERAGETFDPAQAGARLADVALESLVAEDVDGDGSEEYVVVVSYDYLVPSTDPPPRVHQPFFNRRLMVFRDDLTLQADGDIHETWNPSAPKGFQDHDLVRESFRFEPGALVLEWCEADPTLGHCALDIRCSTATERIVVRYDADADNYHSIERERLRDPIHAGDGPCD